MQDCNNKKKLTELDLDRAFASKLSESRDFSRWLLQQTRFAQSADIAVLLDKEQALAKPRKKPENWWRHWWCRLDDGSESETDIFVVYENPRTGKRFALHIEDKPPYGVFRSGQPEDYRRRAEFMANKSVYMRYSEFTTIILAPMDFLQRNKELVTHFECRLPYEIVGKFIPEFTRSISENLSP